MSRKQNPIRFRKARSDATLASIQAVIARKLDIPPESLLLITPTGRKMRSNATVGRLRRDWE